MSRISGVFVAAAALVLYGCAGGSDSPSDASESDEPWITAWSTSQQALGDTVLTDATVPSHGTRDRVGRISGNPTGQHLRDGAARHRRRFNWCADEGCTGGPRVEPADPL